MKTTNVLLAIIAAALVAPQLPALRKVIHNNTVYRVQKAPYERAVEEHKEVLKKWCKDSSSRWVQFTSKEPGQHLLLRQLPLLCFDREAVSSFLAHPHA